MGGKGIRGGSIYDGRESVVWGKDCVVRGGKLGREGMNVCRGWNE